MTYIAYHSKLETSFLMHEFALPPPAPDENEISFVDMSPQKEAPSGTGEDSAKEQSTVKRETTDFVFSSMHSSIVSQILVKLVWTLIILCSLFKSSVRDFQFCINTVVPEPLAANWYQMIEHMVIYVLKRIKA